MKVCDKTCIFCFIPIINKYLCMAKRSLLSRCPSYIGINWHKCGQISVSCYPHGRCVGWSLPDFWGLRRDVAEMSCLRMVTSCLEGIICLDLWRPGYPNDKAVLLEMSSSGGERVQRWGQSLPKSIGVSLEGVLGG